MRQILGSSIRASLLSLALAMLPRAVPAAVLSVNDTGDPGTVGDALLSLREAIRLATGDLSPAGLSAAELARITGGTPGAGSADTIRFGFAGTIALATTNGAEVLPALGSGNDTIDGEGQVVVNGTALAGQSVLWGLRITSSGNVVRGLAFEDVPGSVLHVEPAGGGTITGTQIVANRMTRPGLDAIRMVARALPAAGASVSGGTIDGTVIQGNTVESPGKDAGGINIFSAYAPAAGTVTGAAITNTTITDNTIQDLFQGLFARAALGNGTLSNNQLVGLRIEGNTFLRINDQTCYIGSSNAMSGGSTSDNVTRNVVITGNVFQTRVLDPAAPFLGGGPFVSGGFLDNCANANGSATSLRDVTMDVEISNNQISDRAPYGIFLQAAQSCRGGGGSITESRLENVTVTGNTVGASDTGISLSGAASFETGLGLENARNTLRNVTIDGNTFTGNGIVGVELIAAVSNGGGATDSAIDAVAVTGNTLTGNQVGMAINGGVILGNPNTIRGNQIRGLRISGNTLTGTVKNGITLTGASASGGSTAASHLVDAPEISDNTFQSTGGAAVFCMAGNTASGKGQGNEIRRPRVARNVIRDTTPPPGGNPKGVGVYLLGQPNHTITGAQIEDNTIERVTTFGVLIQNTTGHRVARNTISLFGKKPIKAKKRKNQLTGNIFGPRARKQ